MFKGPNAGRQPLPKAGATQERTLKAVGWTPWLGGKRARRGPTLSSATPRGRPPQGPVQPQAALFDSAPDCSATIPLPLTAYPRRHAKRRDGRSASAPHLQTKAEKILARHLDVRRRHRNVL